MKVTRIYLYIDKSCLIIFVYLANELNSSLSLHSTIKKAKLKHNNVLVNKLVNMRLDLSIYDIIYLHVYIYTNIVIYT